MLPSIQKWQESLIRSNTYQELCSPQKWAHTCWSLAFPTCPASVLCWSQACPTGGDAEDSCADYLVLSSTEHLDCPEAKSIGLQYTPYSTAQDCIGHESCTAKQAAHVLPMAGVDVHTFSMMKAVIPRAAAEASVFAYTMRTSASGPFVIQNLLPLRT